MARVRARVVRVRAWEVARVMAKAVARARSHANVAMFRPKTTWCVI